MRPEGLIIAQLPPWVFEPANSESFDEATFVALPAVGATAIILDFYVPDGRSGVINQLGNVYVGAGFTDGSGDLTWQIWVDGSPIKNRENVTASLGTVASPSKISPVHMVSGQHVQMVIINNSILVAGQLVGARLSGYFYPANLDPAWSIT